MFKVSLKLEIESVEDKDKNYLYMKKNLRLMYNCSFIFLYIILSEKLSNTKINIFGHEDSLWFSHVQGACFVHFVLDH